MLIYSDMYELFVLILCNHVYSFISQNKLVGFFFTLCCQLYYKYSNIIQSWVEFMSREFTGSLRYIYGGSENRPGHDTTNG